MISPGGLSHTPPGGGVGGFQCISANELQQGSVVRNENTSGTRHCMCRDLMDTSCILRNKTEVSWNHRSPANSRRSKHCPATLHVCAKITMSPPFPR
jgi:hypothetical protein